MRGRGLSLPRGHSRGRETVSKARDDTSNDQLRKSERRGLNDCPGDHDTSASEDSLLAAKVVADPDADHRPGKTPQIITADGDALCRRL